MLNFPKIPKIALRKFSELSHRLWSLHVQSGPMYPHMSRVTRPNVTPISHSKFPCHPTGPCHPNLPIGGRRKARGGSGRSPKPSAIPVNVYPVMPPDFLHYGWCIRASYGLLGLRVSPDLHPNQHSLPQRPA